MKDLEKAYTTSEADPVDVTASTYDPHSLCLLSLEMPQWLTRNREVIVCEG